MKTEKVIQLRAVANECRRMGHIEEAEAKEAAAMALVASGSPPRLGPGNEAIPSEPEGWQQLKIRDTLTERYTSIALDASVHRSALLMAPGLRDALPMGLDAAASIDADNSLEKMLAHQMAAAHQAAMRLLGRALSYEGETGKGNMLPADVVESCRLTNAAARMMATFQDGLVTLARIRSKGQTVTVQHVTVQGQAVIGDVTHTGGSRKRGKARGSK